MSLDLLACLLEAPAAGAHLGEEERIVLTSYTKTLSRRVLRTELRQRAVCSTAGERMRRRCGVDSKEIGQRLGGEGSWSQVFGRNGGHRTV
jgi:hypothetical protein